MTRFDPADPADAIPVIDLSRAHLPDDRPQVAQAIVGALAGVGAFYATGTLVPPGAVAAVADAFRPFFEDWDEDARAVYAARDGDAGARGYIARFAADPTADPHSDPDELRSFVFHPYDRRLGQVPLMKFSDRGRALYAHDNLVPDLPGAWESLRTLAALFAAERAAVLALLEEGLGWSPGRFALWLGHGDASTVVVNHYKQVMPDQDQAWTACLAPHTDLGALTFNGLDGRAGIDGVHYRGPQSGEWHPMPEPPAGALPVFAGRLLAEMGAARAFEHWVMCTRRPDQPNRMSVVGFGQPGIAMPVQTASGWQVFGDYYADQIGRARLLRESATSTSAGG